MRYLLFSLLAIFSMMPVKAQIEGLRFRILNEKEKTCEVYYEGYNYSYIDELMIPESAMIGEEEFSVVRISTDAFRGLYVHTITIPGSIKSIGKDAFQSDDDRVANFASLESLCSIQFENEYSNPMCNKGKLLIDGVETPAVIIPDGVKTISDYAFYGAYNVMHLILPESVESIGKYAFYNCLSLSFIDMSSSILSIGEDAFWYGDRERAESVEVNYPSIESLCKIHFDSYYANPLSRNGSLLIDGELISDIIIPDSVANIGDYIFCGCKSIHQVEIPNTVLSIGHGAFSGCGLRSITIPNSVVSIGRYAFSGCGMESMDIPDSVISIGESAFYGCDRLKSIFIPSSVKNIGSDAFGYRNYIDSYLEEASFESIEGLCQIQFGNEKANPMYWSGKLIIDGKDLSNVIIPDGVPEINDYAFYGARNVTSITIPSSVESIGKWAFGRTNLGSISIPGSVKRIGEYAFGDLNYGVYTKEAEFASIESLCSIQFSNEYSNPMTRSQKLIIDGKEMSNVIIPDCVDSIGSYCFFCAKNIRSLSIPNSVKTIGKAAFVACRNLKRIVIPASIEAIGEFAFDLDFSELYGYGSDDSNYTLQEIIYDSEEPISAPANVFSKSFYRNVILKMPEKGLEASRSVSPWVLFLKKEVLSESLVLNPTEWNGIEGEKFQITAVLIPGNIRLESVVWKSSDETVASVDENGLVTVLKPGMCTITATTTDGANISAECIITSSSGVDCVLTDESGGFDVYDINGTLVKVKCDKENLKQLSSGIYILRQNSKTYKIIIR